MIDRVVTLTGPHGSGKTTVGRLLADRLGLQFHSVGAGFRDEAKRRGIDLLALSRLAEQDPSIDAELDRRMLMLAKPGWLLEGQITGALSQRAGVPLLYISVTATEPVRVARLSERDGTEPAVTLQHLRTREASEADRFRENYGIDLSREPFDFEVDTSDLGPVPVAERIADFIRSVAPP